MEINVQCLDRLLTFTNNDALKTKEILDCVYGTFVDEKIVIDRLSKLNKYQTRLKELLLNPGFEQRTPEWYAERKKVITASELLQATGSTNSIRQFLRRKCGLEDISLSHIPAVRHGVIFETVACRAYEARNRVKVHEFGMLTNRKVECFGASPDGIASNGIMLEIKCVYSRHIVDGYIKPEYYQQMQGQMHTAELEECDFLECKITCYDSETEFLEDTGPGDVGDIVYSDLYNTEHTATNVKWGARTLNGMEKGAISYRFDKELDREVFEYSDVVLGTSGVVKWGKDQPDTRTVVFYKIETYNCQRVNLDPKFIIEMEPKIRESFCLYKHYIANITDIDKDYPETQKKMKCKGLKSFAFIGNII
jgi:putative phage-type endonuclease